MTTSFIVVSSCVDSWKYSWYALAIVSARHDCAISIRYGTGSYHTIREGVQHEMKRRLYAPTVLLAGLLSAQIVATAHVYLSNLDLLQATEAILRSGYLAVPNAHVAERLSSLGTAFAGGLLFTASIGAGLSMVTLAAIWLWDRIFRRRRRVVLFYLLIWVTALVLINRQGWNLVASTHLVIVPLITAVAALQLLPKRTTLLSPSGVLWPVSAALVLALLWSLVLDRHMFTNIRDHLLLGNRIGRAVTMAYYDYTLFPAEAFKSLAQKQIRTMVFHDSVDPDSRNRIGQRLRSHDYLPIAAGYPADVTIGVDADSSYVSLSDGDQAVLRVPEQELLGETGKVLADYSDRLDRNRAFRKLTLICLMIGFPLILFTFGFSILGSLPNLFLTVKLSDIVAAVLCVLVGGILLWPVYMGHAAPLIGSDDVADRLSATATTTRIAALKHACEAGRDVAAQARNHALEKSPAIAERYWLARSLACSSDPAADAMLSALSNDPVPIVACQAVWAMGERRQHKMIPELIQRLEHSPHWYLQMYTYRSLRKLGWVQPQSPQHSY
jgi:hypothetical protein